MSDNDINVSNTPLFDQLSREYASNGKSYERMVARPVLVSPWPQTVPSWAKKDELPVRVPGAALPVEEPEILDETVVRTLGGKEFRVIRDSLQFHGISAEEALESASHFPDYVKSDDNPHMFYKDLQKPEKELLATETIDPIGLEMDYDGGFNGWRRDFCQKTMLEHPDHTLFTISVDQRLDGNVVVMIHGHLQISGTQVA